MVHVARSAVAPAVGVRLQKELSREGERRYTKLSVGEKMRLQFDNMVSDTKKTMRRSGIGAKLK
jgi:hypothetical protein